jgi:hypothetical protein
MNNDQPQNNFYCQRVVGDSDFSIKEWNEQLKLCRELNIKMPWDNLQPCSKQCANCIALVEKQQIKTRSLPK